MTFVRAHSEIHHYQRKDGWYTIYQKRYEKRPHLDRVGAFFTNNGNGPLQNSPN
jgi:hypothetical protein